MSNIQKNVGFQVLKKSSRLEALELHDISIDPIRAAHAAGQFHQEEALQLTKVLSDSAGRLKQLKITAGSWSWESLCILFESLKKAGNLRCLRLRGKLMDAKGSHEALTGPIKGKSLSVLGSIWDFSWQGSNIYDAKYLEGIILALPNAESRFRMESSGAWRGPYEVELRAFEKLSTLGRIKVAKDATFVPLRPGILDPNVPFMLRSMMNLCIAPAGGEKWGS
jgi:hypothetical protein